MVQVVEDRRRLGSRLSVLKYLMVAVFSVLSLLRVLFLFKIIISRAG